MLPHVRCVLLDAAVLHSMHHCVPMQAANTLCSMADYSGPATETLSELSSRVHDLRVAAGTLQGQWPNLGAQQNNEIRLRGHQAAWVRRGLDGRVVWFGGWNDSTCALETIGYFLGDVKATQRDGRDAWLSHTSIDECQRRLQHGNMDWSAVPVVQWAHHMRPGRNNDLNQGLDYYPSLADYLSTWITTYPPYPLFLRDVSNYHHMQLRPLTEGEHPDHRLFIDTLD